MRTVEHANLTGGGFRVTFSHMATILHPGDTRLARGSQGLVRKPMVEVHIA
jgi:hypothetical protein